MTALVAFGTGIVVGALLTMGAMWFTIHFLVKLGLAENVPLTPIAKD